MRYISIDIETTGLDPNRHQILEFGAVIGDTEVKYNLNNRIVFHRIILHRTITGDPFAINMNQEIIKEISKQFQKQEPNETFTTEQGLIDDFKEFLVENKFLESIGDYKTKINVAGKNFANFDKLFIDKLFKFNYSSRILDPAILYYQEGDKRLPDLKTCLNRAGLIDEVSHRAVGDAFQVVLLLQKKLNKE
jgi:oligoribonuclease